MDYFFYGTLMDAQVLHAVLRHPVAKCRLRPAMLVGWRRVHRDGASYPVIVPAFGSVVDGILARRLSVRDSACLREYEGPEYDTARLPVRTPSGRTVLAAVFVPRPSCPVSATPWNYATWQRCSARGFIQRVRRTRRAPTN